MIPGDSERAQKMRRAIHHFPAWLETRDAMIAREAYQRTLKLDHRPILTSHLLFKTRNRQASNPRDQVYGLYYLLQAAGYQLPPIVYSQSVADVYEGVALAVLQQSRSWWILISSVHQACRVWAQLRNRGCLTSTHKQSGTKALK